MSIETIYKCDVCGIQKGKANHWFIAELGNYACQFRRWNYAGESDMNRYTHLCGEKCCQALLSRFLSQSPNQPTFEVTA